MTKKARPRVREDGKPVKAGGNKPVKVVTFDTPEPESPGRPQFLNTHDVSDNEPAASGSAAWGQSASDGWNNSSSSWPQPSSPPASLPAPSLAPQAGWAPFISSPLRTGSAAPVGENATQNPHKLMIDGPHKENQNWNANHHADVNQSQWGTPASNGAAPLPVPPVPQPFSPAGTMQSFGAMGATVKNPAQWTSASEQARQFARPPATLQAQSQPAPKPSAPMPPLPTTVPPPSQTSVHQWAARSKAVPPSPAVAERFGNREDYAIVAAALNGEIKKAHYSRQMDDSGHAGSTIPAPGAAGRRNSNWSQQPDAGWRAPMKGAEAGWDTRSKGRNDGAGGWGNVSEAGWSQNGRSGHHHPQKDHSHSSAVMNHGNSKSWQAWGKQARVEPEKEPESDGEEDDEDDEDEDWYGEQPSNAAEGWGAPADDGWTNQSSAGRGGQGGGGWDQEISGRGGQGGGGWDQGTSGRGGQGGGGWDQGTSGRGGQGGGGWDQGTSGRGGQGGGGWDQGTSGRGGQGGGGWDQGTSGRGGQGGGGWDQGTSGRGSKGGGKKENSGFNAPGGDGWTMNSRGDGGANPAEKSSSKENGGWNTSIGDGWTTNSGAWDNDQGWDTNQTSWGQSKVMTDPPGMAGTRNSLSPEQRSQILNNLLDDPHAQKSQNKPLYPRGVSLTDNPVPIPHKSHKQWQSWAQQDGWDPIEEEEEDDSEVDDALLPTVTQSQARDPWISQLDTTSYSMPSKTLTYAYKDTDTSLDPSKPRNSVSEHTAVQFVESHGEALKPVEQALFGRARWVEDRIHWMFSPNKDERVSKLLTWIESMAYHLGTFGLHKFLQSRERGAIVTNAAFRLPEFPGQPVFDWLTFDRLQDTMDKTLQESVVFYDPGIQVIVYVLLPSATGRSVAMWRRKIKVPNNARVRYLGPLTQAMAGLKKQEDYVVYVDRIPMKPEDPDKPKASEPSKATLTKSPTKKLAKDSPATMKKPAKDPSAPTKKKRKWWQIFK